MTYSTTIAGSGSYDVASSTGRVLDIWITNNGTGDVYVGDIPGPAIVRTATANSGDTFIDLQTEADAAGIEQGMDVTDGGNIGAAAVVTSVRGKRVNLSVANADTEAGFACTFTPPAISSSNGHLLQSGETAHWSAGNANHAPNHGKRIVADGTGATVTITAHRA
jgi:hypothetical protein